MERGSGWYTLLGRKRRALGAGALQMFLQKLRKDSILSAQRSKVNQKLETTLLSAAASAVCCMNMVKKHSIYHKIFS